MRKFTEKISLTQKTHEEINILFKIIEEYIVKNWNKIEISDGSPISPSSLIKPGGPEGGLECKLISPGKICIYNKEIPAAWVKFCKNKKYYQTIGQEYRNLVYVYNKVNSSMQESIPAPVALKNLEGNHFFIESFMKGRRMSEEVKTLMFFGRKKLTQNFLMIQKWLLEFQTQTRQGDLLFTQDTAEEYFLKPFNTFSKEVSLDEQRKEFLENYKRRVKNIGDFKVPVVSSHGDYFAGNILLNGKKGINVIDWCDFEKESNPFLDIFTLISTFRLPGINNQENIMNSLHFSFLERNWFSIILKKFIREYFSSLEIDFEVVKIFYPIFLMNRIIREDAARGRLRTQYWTEHLNLYIKNEEKFWY